MTEEERQKLDEIYEFMQMLKNSSSIPYDVDVALRDRLFDLVTVLSLGLPSGLTGAPLGSITAPSGGATVDSQARTAINTIITRLEVLGLVDEN